MTPVVRCSKCNLNQFLTTSGKCRKCGQKIVLMLDGKIKSKGNLHIRVALSIRFIRRLKKLSQKDLAKRIDVPRTLVNRWENGLHPPTPSSICKIAEGLGVSPQLIIAAAEEIDLAQEEKIANRTA